jgi:hypothetical protein
MTIVDVIIIGGSTVLLPLPLTILLWWLREWWENRDRAMLDLGTQLLMEAQE